MLFRLRVEAGEVAFEAEGGRLPLDALGHPFVGGEDQLAHPEHLLLQRVLALREPRLHVRALVHGGHPITSGSTRIAGKLASWSPWTCRSRQSNWPSAPRCGPGSPPRSRRLWPPRPPSTLRSRCRRPCSGTASSTSEDGWRRTGPRSSAAPGWTPPAAPSWPRSWSRPVRPS